MPSPRPIVPLCMTTAPDGTVYLATFAYWEAALGTDPNPDFFVVLKGNIGITITIGDSTEHIMEWIPAAAIQRNAVNILPNKGNVYTCAISPDYETFVLQVVPSDYLLPSYNFNQLFSIQVPLGRNEDDAWFQPIQMVLDERLNRTIEVNPDTPYAMVSAQEWIGTPYANGFNDTTTANVPQSYREWFHFKYIHGGQPPFVYAQTVNGSLPSRTMDGPNVQIFPKEENFYCRNFAVSDRTLYGYCKGGSMQQAIFSMPLTYNTTFELTAQSSVQSWRASFAKIIPCLDSAMVVNSSVVYVFCEDIASPVLFSLDTLTNKTSEIKIQKDRSMIEKSIGINRLERAPSTLRVLSNRDRLLIYHFSYEDPSLLYIIDIDSGRMSPMRVDKVRAFSSQNQNRLMTTDPLTLSSLSSVLIGIATLLLGVFLILSQGRNEKKGERKRERKWVLDNDIPGSKVVDETGEVTMEAYQRAQTNGSQRGLPSALQDHFLSPSSSPSPQFSQQTLRVRGNHLGASPSLSEADAVDLSDRSSPFLQEYGLEPLQFSSHPRPNVVTVV